MENYLTISEIAKLFNCSQSSVRNFLYKRKNLPYIKKNRVVLIEESVFKQYYTSIKRGRPYTEDEKVLWFKEFSDGSSLRQIADKYKRDISYISEYLRNTYQVDTKQYYKRRSKEEKELFHKMKEVYLTEGNISVSEVAKRFGVDRNVFMNYLKRCQINIKSFSDIRSYVTNPDFFNVIDSEIKAYLLGFFAADGHIEKHKNNIKIGVHIDDSHILELYNKYICSNKCVLRCIPNKNMVEISFGHVDIHQAILKLGFDNRKTYTWKSLPNIESNLMRHFIRGYFDGDGSIMFNRRKAHNRLSGYNRKFSIACFNSDILKSIASAIGIEHYTIKHTEKNNFKIGDSNIKTASGYLLDVTHKEDLKKIYYYLYNEAHFFFKRKKDKFDLAILEDNKISDALQGNL